MKTQDLDFNYPENLVAKTRADQSRVMAVDTFGCPTEIRFQELLFRFRAGDLLVLNDTKVLKRRVFSGDIEILFLNHLQDGSWEVLFPSKKAKIGDEFELPGKVMMKLVQKGRPQIVRLNAGVDESYFEKYGELPLPPYIQKARGERHNVHADESWYQTAWNQKPGSFAAPTASLHFSNTQIEDLLKNGVNIEKVTLHVGLGTFLPVMVEDLDQHEMHSEYVEIPHSVRDAIARTRQNGGRVWALGTTVVRALESDIQGSGVTNILIQPGYQWKYVDILMTNFHQPKSTLLALVCAFAGMDQVKACYQWAIERNFRLFSYGDLSVWERKS